MQNTRPLYWRQGLFLTPQHFQQQDLFHQGQRQYLWQLEQPFGWGIRTLAIREDGLAANTLDVLRCELITRDGLLVQAGSEAAQPNAPLSPRKFEEFLDPTGRPLSAYLALPRHQAASAASSPGEATPPAGATRRRYRFASQERPDLFDSDTSKTDIGFVEYNLALLFEREDSFANAGQSFELIKIAELLPATSGVGARLSTTYIPPCLTVSSSVVLLARLRGLRDFLTGKGNEFAAIKRQLGLRATATSLQDVVRLVMLQTLNRYIPLLHHCLEVGSAHPEPVYALLRQLVGELSAFSEEVSVLGAPPGDRDIPAYDHEALWPCFDVVLTRINELVRSMTLGPEAGIRLDFDGQYFTAPLPPTVFEGERARYYLMIESLLKGEELSAKLQQTGKISTLEDLPKLRQAALAGLKITYLPVPPEELPQRGGTYSYFSIDTSSPIWKRIREMGNIALFCPLDPNDTAIKLLVVRAE